MNSKIFGIAIFLLTAISVIAYPMYKSGNANANVNPPANHVQNGNGSTPPVNAGNAKKIDVVFVLDTTGSMGGLIQSAKEKIWSIASTMASSQSAPEIRMGLVAYRDRGDDYVTRIVDLNNDLDSMYAQLMDFNAQGGGDTPESVNQALYDAVYHMSWSEQDDNVYKVVFLVGDAPAHMDYQDEVQFPEILLTAQQKGIVVNTIQCGNLAGTQFSWQQIASLGQGNYFRVNQSGSAIAMATPYDKKLAELSMELDETRLYYGDEEVKALKQAKVEAAKKLHAFSSDASRARRATFNSSGSGRKNLLGENELVEDIASGKVKLSDIDSAALPEPMLEMAPAEQQKLVNEVAEKRKKLEAEISELAQQREDFLKKKVKEKGDAKDSLDEKIYSAIKEQAAAKGFRYDDDSASY